MWAGTTETGGGKLTLFVDPGTHKEPRGESGGLGENKRRQIMSLPGAFFSPFIHGSRVAASGVVRPSCTQDSCRYDTAWA